jgi:hypothetical protein
MWCYRAGGTWKKVAAPIPWQQDGGDVEESLEKARFHRLSEFVIEDSRLRLVVYENTRDSGFLVLIWISDTGFDVLAESFPALLGLLRLLLPLVNDSAALERVEEEWHKELRELERKRKVAAPTRQPPAVPPRAPAGGLFPETPATGPYGERR